jgi:hypothetical protein
VGADSCVRSSHSGATVAPAVSQISHRTSLEPQLRVVCRHFTCVMCPREFSAVETNFCNANNEVEINIIFPSSFLDVVLYRSDESEFVKKLVCVTSISIEFTLCCVSVG